MTGISLDERAVELGAVRMTGPEGFYYGPTGIHSGDQQRDHRAVGQLFRQSLTLTEARADSYAILDAYDEHGDIVADYGIPNARTFRWLYRKLNWRRHDGSGGPGSMSGPHK